MRLSIANRGALGREIVKYGTGSTRQLRRVNEQAARELARVAAEMAPYRFGDLEGDITVKRVKQGNSSSYLVSTENVPYAIYMHESVYNLGPGSVKKQASSRFKVGRKFLSRATQYILRDWGFYDKVARAMRMK